MSAGVVVLADHRLGGGLARPLLHLLHLLRPLRLYRGLPLLLLQITGLQPPSASTLRPYHHHSNTYTLCGNEFFFIKRPAKEYPSRILEGY